jgi:large subunit ribosomal protein L15
MELNTLAHSTGRKTSRRVGRGGKRGKTSGRGGKGQTARAGNKRRPEWRDLIKKLPKRRGYGKNRARTVVARVPVASVSLSSLAKKFENGATISPYSLAKAGLVRRVSGKFPPVKILGTEIGLKLSFEKVLVSAKAKEAIEKAGGSVSHA